jgi:hypothetical protein
MKKNTLLLFSFSLSFLFYFHAAAQCKVSKMVEQGKFEIDSSYRYDGFSLSSFTMNDKARRMQVQFTALKGQKYKLYFLNSGFAEELKVSVFKEEKEGKLSTDLLGATTIKDQYIELDLSKAGNYTIDYSIPTAENAEYGMTKEECMVVLISYKER